MTAVGRKSFDIYVDEMKQMVKLKYELSKSNLFSIIAKKSREK
jgi:hypothetical protein